MSLIIDTNLPASSILKEDGIMVNTVGLSKPDRRIALINLMPVKPDTELDFMRRLGASDLAVEIVLVKMVTHHSNSRNTSTEHIERFYQSFKDASEKGLDGVIITGAPLENVAFEDVDYWDEITEIMNQCRIKNIPVFNVCWAAFAALYFWHGIRMQILEKKISGVYQHHILSPTSKLMHGINEGFFVPHSRFAAWRREDVEQCDELTIVADSEGAGIYMLESKLYPEYYVIGHGEYATETLNNEYHRDLNKGMHPIIPVNYYPNNNPELQPENHWQTTANKIFNNWLLSLK